MLSWVNELRGPREGGLLRNFKTKIKDVRRKVVKTNNSLLEQEVPDFSPPVCSCMTVSLTQTNCQAEKEQENLIVGRG